MSSKREKKLREAIDACNIICEAVVWLDENVAADVPDSYDHMYPTPATKRIARLAKVVRDSLERQLGRELHKQDASLFDRLLKAKCGD